MTLINYHHLKYEDGCQIYALTKSGRSQHAITKQLSVHPSTIGRELKRNKGKRGYRYKQVQIFALTRRKKASVILYKMTSNVVAIIEKKLCEYQWNPEQISGWLKLNMKINISHECIYQHAWKDKHNGGSVIMVKNITSVRVKCWQKTDSQSNNAMQLLKQNHVSEIGKLIQS